MTIEDFAYIVETKKSFDEAVVAVLKAVEKKGWGLFQIYDIKERLAAKGFQQQSLKIIEICSAKYANNMMSQNKLTSLCMPCKINVIQDGSVVKIVGMKPTVMLQFFEHVNKEEALSIENELKEIVNQANL